MEQALDGTCVLMLCPGTALGAEGAAGTLPRDTGCISETQLSRKLYLSREQQGKETWRLLLHQLSLGGGAQGWSTWRTVRMRPCLPTRVRDKLSQRGV